MNKLLLLTLLLAATLLAAAPVLTNVAAGQLNDQVLISYQLAHPDDLPCDVSLQVSNDGGASYTIFPAALSGDFGTIAATSAGAQYQINWDYAQDGVGNGNNYRVKVIADDGAGEVAPPVFTPPAGSYENAQNVTITCATNGATIRYTTDGSDPDPNSPEYSTPVPINETTTLKARGFKPGWTASAISSAEYTITPSNMVFLPGGSFTMGDTRGVGDVDELPTHSVILSPFYIGRCEVTQGEWQAVMGSNPASGYGVGDNYPVYSISFYSILKFCNLLSLSEGFTPVYSISGSTNPADWGTVPTSWNDDWSAVVCDWTANGYRMPTEAEWEYAARGGTNTPDYLYAGSEDINAVAWYNGNNTPDGTKPVGTKATNGIGAYDFSGNVWEWCWDWNGDYSAAAQTNPTGPATGDYRIIRSGFFLNTADYCRVTKRYSAYVYDAGFYVGFRLGRTGL
ncbi:MAG: SUMF1/EgtB/PvdO family nonheme iron enzyme [Candidatus Cloacimonetes bacterium]|nr:SUMF1/EgtB/PvdO family nonheme iron enzyme [Candidatus Cloacimonadota bacterium]